MIKENSVYSDFIKLLNNEVPNRVPVTVWNSRSTSGLPKEAKNLLDYYKKVDIKLEAQLLPLEYFGDTLIMPGVCADYGVVLEASAFGC